MAGLSGYGGRNATTFGGRLAATIGPSEPAPPPEPRDVGASGFGGRNATTFGGTRPAVIGGPNAAPESVGQLLQGDGFVLVAESGDERARYAAEDGPAHGLTSLEIATETNALASWSGTLPADRELFDWPFADIAVGHDGDRLFHGRLLTSAGSSDDNEVEVSGFGRLFELTAGGMTFSCSDCADYEAINEFWKAIAARTNGRIRGFAVRPPVGRGSRVGEEPLEFEGTPMEIAKSLHGQFGFAFSLDHANPAAVVESFPPGTQTRSASWTALDHDVALDPSSYHNHVIIEGAEKPSLGEQGVESANRYRGEARAPDGEIEALANGQLITHQPLPDDDLTSDAACQARAQSLLEELRGQYSIAGNVSATPVGVVPGYTYAVPSFDAAAPAPARPVAAVLRKATHTLVGGASTELDFGSERGVVAAIRRARSPALAPGGVSRQQDGLYEEPPGMAGTADAYSSEYPHGYYGEPDSIEAWGEGYWGLGAWGGNSE